MKITTEWLAENNACQDGYNWFAKQGKDFEPIPLLNLLIEKNQLDWANWLIVRVMEYSQYVSYAVYAAELVIDIFEKKYPNDKRPREAIEAAKRCIENPSKENKKTADRAASAAWGAYNAAGSAAWAAYSATGNAAYREAYWAAWAAYWAVYWAADSAKTLKKILKYGIELLTEGK